MKRSGIKRATAIKTSARRMKSRKPSPTKAQSARMGAIKQGECMACRINASRAQHRCDGAGCDAHHLLSGGRRRGHAYTIALCPWHHRGIRPDDCRNDEEAFHKYGPSLALHPRDFKETYGSDDELLAMQNELLGEFNAY